MALGTVLIVPGTGGSELSTPPSFFGLGPPIRVWLNYPVLVAGAWRWLGLMPDGITPSFPGVGILQPGHLIPDYWGIFSTRFSWAGWSVVHAQTRWISQIDTDAQNLADLIRSMGADAPIHCLAHSRGGLVLRAALNLLSASGDLGMVGRCAGLGVPHYGSWESSSLLSGFQRSEILLGALVAAAPGGGIISSIWGSLQEVVRTWPVSYELQPAPGAPGSPPAAISLVYSAPAWSGVGISVSADWCARSATRWASAAPVPSAVEWIDVVGTGLSTPDQLVADHPPTSPADYSYSTDGDGVVLARWATQPDRVRIATPTAHHSLVSDGRLMAALHDYLLHGLSANVTIAGSILR